MISQAPLRYVIFSLSPRPKQMIPYHTVERKERRRRFSRTQEQVNSPIIFHICFFPAKEHSGPEGQIRSNTLPSVSSFSCAGRATHYTNTSGSTLYILLTSN